MTVDSRFLQRCLKVAELIHVVRAIVSRVFDEAARAVHRLFEPDSLVLEASVDGVRLCACTYRSLFPMGLASLDKELDGCRLCSDVIDEYECLCASSGRVGEGEVLEARGWKRVAPEVSVMVGGHRIDACVMPAGAGMESADCLVASSGRGPVYYICEDGHVYRDGERLRLEEADLPPDLVDAVERAERFLTELVERRRLEELTRPCVRALHYPSIVVSYLP